MFGGENLVELPDERMQRLRGSRIAMIFQDPMMTLNPVLRIDTQMIEAILAHNAGLGRAEVRQRAIDAPALREIAPGHFSACHLDPPEHAGTEF